MNDVCLLPVTGSSSLIPIALIATTLVASGVLLRRWVARGVGVAAVVAALAIAGLAAAPAEAADDCPPATTAAAATPSSSAAPGTTAPGSTPSTTVVDGSSTTAPVEETTTTTVVEETTTTEAQPSSPLRAYSGVICTTRLDEPGGEPREDWRFQITNGQGTGMLYQSTDGSCTAPFEEDEPFTVVVAADPGDPDTACQFVGHPSGNVLADELTFSPAIPGDFVSCLNDS